MSSAVIPQTYAQWRHCIEVDCQIALTLEFVASRLQALRNAQGQEARRFPQLYGALADSPPDHIISL